MSESALILHVPEAEALVASLRERCDESAKLGAPAHITVLFPFMPPERIDAVVLDRIRRVVGASSPFGFSLAMVARFPLTAYLAPEPSAPFVAITESLVTEFPQFQPFAGRFSTIVPHLTVAHGDAGAAASAAEELAAMLLKHGPIKSTCRVLQLIENSTGRWRQRHEFPLAVDA